MLYIWIYIYVKFSERECQQWRMVLCEWCQLWDHSLPYLAYTGQVYAAEHKVLSIKQGVEFYYFNSRILIIYFIFF